jgi:hypothetical protein
LKFSQNFWEDGLSMFKVQLNVILPLCQILQRDLVHLETSYAFLFPTTRAACHAHLILIDVIILIAFDWRTNYDVCQFAVFFSLRSLSPSRAQRLTPTSCSLTLSVCVYLLSFVSTLVCGQCRPNLDCSAVPMMCDSYVKSPFFTQQPETKLKSTKFIKWIQGPMEFKWRFQIKCITKRALH